MRKEKTVDFHLKWAWHSISKLYNGIAARFDLTMATSYVLLNIDMEKGTPATKIGPLLGMEPRSMVRTLKTMEEKGLVYREVDDHDKRFVRIVLTELGREKREYAREEVIRFNNLIRQRIPMEKLDVFFDVMQHIKAVVEEETIKLKSEGQDSAASPDHL